MFTNLASLQFKLEHSVPNQRHNGNQSLGRRVSILAKILGVLLIKGVNNVCRKTIQKLRYVRKIIKK